jgi:DNA-binding NarL/FixJ family response regulator
MRSFRRRQYYLGNSNNNFEKYPKARCGEPHSDNPTFSLLKSIFCSNRNAISEFERDSLVQKSVFASTTGVLKKSQIGKLRYAMQYPQTLLFFDNLDSLQFAKQLVCERCPASRVLVYESVEQLEKTIDDSQNSDQPTIVITDKPMVSELAKSKKAFLPTVLIENASNPISNDQIVVTQTNAAMESGTIAKTIDFSEHEEVVESLDQAIKAASQFQSLKSRSANLEDLAARERKIIQLAADGIPNKTIAVRLGVSIKTVEKNRRNAYSKLSVSSTAEMASLVTFEKFFGAFA